MCPDDVIRDREGIGQQHHSLGFGELEALEFSQNIPEGLESHCCSALVTAVAAFMRQMAKPSFRL